MLNCFLISLYLSVPFSSLFLLFPLEWDEAKSIIVGKGGLEKMCGEKQRLLAENELGPLLTKITLSCYMSA